uniref:Uncharacterized protein n=1 Tax=Ditylum brightwellii TaxID=49249 RepID=A0A7S4RSI7_9STRA
MSQDKLTPTSSERDSFNDNDEGNIRLPWPEERITTAPNSSIATRLRHSCICAFYNRWTYSYMNRLFKKGALQKKNKSAETQLTQNDLYSIPTKMKALVLGRKFWKLYDEHNGKYAFFKALWHLVAPTFVPAGFCQAVALTSQILVPICVMQLLIAVEIDSSSSTNSLFEDTILYVIAIFVLSVLNAFCTHRYQFLSYQSGIVIRTAVSSAIYEKSLILSPKGREGLTSGYVTNLVATDTQKLFEVMHDGHMIWSAPLAILVIIIILLIIIGPPCLVGAFILIALVPLSTKFASLVINIRRQRVAVADERVEITTAMLQGIKVTKLNNYEDKFEARVAEARQREVKLVKKEQFVWGMTLVIRVCTPVIATAATLVTFVLVSENNVLTASDTFTILMLFNMIKFPINQAGQLLSKAALGIQAMQRIGPFMDREDGKGDHATYQESSSRVAPTTGDDKIALEVKNGTFLVRGSDSFCATSSDVSTGSEEAGETICDGNFTLSDINFSVAKGEVLAVVGEVASGKSTLLQGLLGDIQTATNTVVTKSGRVTFAGQTPFILSCTVRENILFGLSFDKGRYEKVLEACCLVPDLQMWPAGDLTEIGERGVTMSGGQKQRVSIARAVYANPDVALFDDILSALDSGTSQKVFRNLFEDADNGLLNGCGVVLVTHAVHVLQRVSKILVLDEGKPIFFGTWDALQSYEPQNSLHKSKLHHMRSSLQSSRGEDNAEVPTDIKSATGLVGTAITADDDDAIKGEIMTVEEREHGTSALGIWLLWFSYAGGVLFAIIQIVLMGCDRGSYVIIDWWLASWTSAENQSISVLGRQFPNQMDGRPAQLQYITVYAIIILVMSCFLFSRTQWAIRGGVRVCERMFSNMTHRVLHAPMSYFDTTPLGRILNRFTYDVEQVDITLSQFMSVLMIACSWLTAGLVVMITLVPYMAIINAFVLCIYLLILRQYRWGATDLQRLDAVSRSPIQASLAEGLGGSTTIRAFQKNHHFLGVFQSYIDENSSAMLNFVSSRRWLAVRLETLGAIVTLAACLFISAFNNRLGLSPGLSGLLIIWASTLTITLGFLINSFSEVEAAITSIERMHSMELLPQEKSMVTSEENAVDSSWPRKGLLEFNDVAMRYRPNLPLALDGLTFTLQHGQRCAVVGRTGAGKSTITTALFRLVEIERGTISLDGVDLSTLGLSDVRGRPNSMFILPQDPVLFSGSIRSNLDPLSVHDNKDMVEALTLVCFPGANSKRTEILQETVEEGGANYSSGEKQLLCLARAMLSKPRLLVLDEATSAVDGSTDEFVQKMLRSQFRDTTLLTIAHRLNTVIDYDTVLVIEDGKVAELGSPKSLLENKDGKFTAMVNATGLESAAALKKMAN